MQRSLAMTFPRETGPVGAGKFQFSRPWPGGGFSIKTSRLSEQQIAFILPQADEGTSVAEVCGKAGVSEATYYNWRKTYGRPIPSDMKRLRQLESLPSGLTRGGERQAQAHRGGPGARQGDGAGRHQAKALSPARRREMVGHRRARRHRVQLSPARRREMVDQVRVTWQVSMRRACAVLGAERSSYHYEARRRSQAALSKRIKEIAETRVRYGYRRIHVL
jgi:hypothetical protein